MKEELILLAQSHEGANKDGKPAIAKSLSHTWEVKIMLGMRKTFHVWNKTEKGYLLGKLHRFGYFILWRLVSCIPDWVPTCYILKDDFELP